MGEGRTVEILVDSSTDNNEPPIFFVPVPDLTSRGTRTSPTNLLRRGLINAAPVPLATLLGEAPPDRGVSELPVLTPRGDATSSFVPEMMLGALALCWRLASMEVVGTMRNLFLDSFAGDVEPENDVALLSATALSPALLLPEMARVILPESPEMWRGELADEAALLLLELLGDLTEGVQPSPSRIISINSLKSMVPSPSASNSVTSCATSASVSSPSTQPFVSSCRVIEPSPSASKALNAAQQTPRWQYSLRSKVAARKSV
mmetsp:Transcript_139990/g.447728  ORF Transcript_139990/g.447728 Transcript_139990/m.447728 type:complete len:262 (+) Transcript_139990:269-1054(+)